MVLDVKYTTVKFNHKKLSCRREIARCIMSLNISLSHSRSLKVIKIVPLESLDTVSYSLSSNYGRILYHF